MTNTKDKQYALSEYLRNIHHISDKNYQRRVWIRGEGPECDDFTETVCYNSLMSKAIFANYQEYNISDSQLNTLKNFHDEFRKFWEDNDWPPFFIDTPEWTKIAGMAKDVLKAFDYEKGKNAFAMQELEEERKGRIQNSKHSLIENDMEELTNEQKQHILDLILSIIVRISDKDYQRRVWIHAEGPEVGDFGETVCYYSGLTEDVFENYSEYGISDIQFPVIKKFHYAFQKFWDDNDWPQDFIDTPEWTEITEMARDVLQAFNCTKESIHLALEESMKRHENRRQTVQFLLKDISKIATEKNQGKVGALVEGNDNFFETVDHYFNTIESILEDYRNYEISTAKIQTLKKFHEAFSKFWNDKETPYLFIGSPEWIEIAVMAKDVLKAFHYSEMEKTPRS